MTLSRSFTTAALSGLIVTSLLALPSRAAAQLNNGSPVVLSTGQRITPLVPRQARFEPLNPNLADNPEYTAGQAVTTVVSPDHRTLLVLTSGYNLENYTSGSNEGATNPSDSNEYVFVFDISSQNPVQKQVIQVPNTYQGIVFNPSGTEFYVSGGDNDNVHIYDLKAGMWMESATAVSLGHLALANPATGSSGGLGLSTPPEAAGIAVTADGKKLVVADYENDAISVLTAGSSGWTKTGELDLRPGVADPTNAEGVPGGEYPYWVAIKGNDTAYVSSIRDREIVAVNISGTPSVTARIRVPGQPNRMVLNKAQTMLYVAQDNRDTVAVIDLANASLIDEIKITAPADVFANSKGYYGANPNSLTLSPDEKTLYVTNGAENAVAVVNLSTVAGGSYVAGLIPTGFYPNSISTSSDGKFLYIVNGKSAIGPNPQNCESNATYVPHANCNAPNQYILQLTKAGFQSLPTPNSNELSMLTQKVIENDHLQRQLNGEEQEKLLFLRSHIKHVIYIVKENRTYDQVLGDLEVGNGDPSITQFPEVNTPNFHNFARNFTDFDNFYDTSDVSFDGWSWSTSARTTDVTEKEVTVNYAGRGVSYDTEGSNRNLNMGYGDLAARQKADPLTPKDPNLLPGNGNVGAPDEEEGGNGEGYLWNAAMRKHLTVRNYGFLLDLTRYSLPAAYKAYSIPEDPNAFADHLQVAYSANKVLRPHTDKYFRGFDNTMPDYYRFTEWDREFKQYEASGNLPNLSLVRLMHDHFGNFSTALNGVNVPELQIADNDYAVGKVVDAIAHSRYKDNTLIFVIEDDAQDGGDHVDGHRSTAFIVGPYVKHNFVDSTRYDTVSMVRTMEDILNVQHLNLNDESAMPMLNAFDTRQAEWNYTATPSVYLQKTTLPIPKSAYAAQTAALNWHPLHSAAWWAEQTKGMDFSVEDHLDAAKFNRVVWEGTMGNTNYPTVRSGLDLRGDRAHLLADYRKAQQQTQESENGPVATGLGPAN